MDYKEAKTKDLLIEFAVYMGERVQAHLGNSFFLDARCTPESIACEFIRKQNIGQPYPDDLTVCDNCGHECTYTDITPLEEVVDLSLRLTPGSVVPAGACPECSCLTYIQHNI